jgi:hypothetical protein
MGKPAAPAVETTYSTGTKRIRDEDAPGDDSERLTTGARGDADVRGRTRPTACVHTVALPEGFDASASSLDPSTYGESSIARFRCGS